MCVQLSLFDLSGNLDAVAPIIRSSRLAGTQIVASEPVTYHASPAPSDAPQPVRLYGEAKPHDMIQPMGDLARLVLARYDLMARRREEMMRRRAAQPRKSIRVLSEVS